tara:strand:- start:182 stop:1234 length:1053 start_codon:yes stop_codon:yes gene_type:complete
MLTRPHIAALQRHATEQESNAFVLSVTDERLKKLHEIVYNGDIGDAMMHPTIDDIIIEIDKKRPRMVQHIHTNGGGAWYEKFKKIAQHVDGDLTKNIFFIFSIDGLEDTNHLYRRNVQWKHIVKNAEILRKHKVHARWRMNRFKHNEHQIDTARQMAQDWGWEFSINYGTWGHEKVADLIHQPSNPSLYKEKLKSWKENKFLEFREDDYEYLSTPQTPFKDTCVWKQDKEIQVVSDMTVWPCCWTAHHHYQYWINNEKIWNEEEISPKNTIDVSKNLKDIKQWQQIMSIDKTKKYLDNKDIKITKDHLMYDVLVSDTFKHIDNNLQTNGIFNLDVCSETCRQIHKASASQ